MRILLIANTLPPTDISGVGEQVVQLAAGLRSLGHRTETLGRGPGGAPGPKLLFPVAVLPAFVRACRRFRPHVVQVHESDGALVALFARVLQAVLDPSPRVVALLQVSYREEMRAVRPLCVNGRIVGRPSARELLFRWLKAPIQVVLGCLTAWLVDLVLAPSRRTALEIEHDYGVGGVEVLPNATTACESGPGAVSELPPPGYLLFVGRLRIRKALEVLLHAMPPLLQDFPEVRLVVAGDGEHRERLERAVSALGLQRQVQFLGRCTARRVRVLMTAARVLVVPSIYEGMPLVILEAMSCGLPIVASAVSGIPEVVREGETGWLVPPEDSAALIEALRNVYQQPEEAQRRGEAARQWVKAAAAPAHAARRWLELVEVASPPPAALDGSSS